MPTLEHNVLVEMFRENPELAPHFLATLFHLEVPPHASVAVVESSLDQLIPVEFRADLVLELRDANGRARAGDRPRGPARQGSGQEVFSWPVYVAVVRAKKRCRAVVLVVAPDADVAAWAAENIDLGLGFGSLRPLSLATISACPFVASSASFSAKARVPPSASPSAIQVRCARGCSARKCSSGAMSAARSGT